MAARIRDKITIAIIITFISSGCLPKTPEFEAVDMVQWRSDHKACDGARMLTKDAFTRQKDKVLGLSESQIVACLGNPDIQELSKRNQKFYYYYLEPHGECATADSSIRPLRMAIRFNAMGLAKEVRMEKNY